MKLLLSTRPARSDRASVPARRRRHVSLVEHLEERCVLSTGHALAIPHALAAHRSAHHFHPAAVVAPAASSAFQVQWSFPDNNQTVGGGPGFIAVSFTELPDWKTATADTVQLAHQNSDGTWSQPIPTTIWVNPGNNSVVLVPNVVQPNGRYAIGLNPGLRSVNGDSIGGPVYRFFTINDPWGTLDPIKVFPSDNGSTGVVIADQSRALDPTSVNGSTVQVFKLNPDGSHGAQVPVTIVYDPNIPSIELAIQVGLKAGTYQFVEHGVRDAAGNVLTGTFTRNFTIATDQVPPGPEILPSTPISVAATFPNDGQTVYGTSVASVTFNQAPDPTTITTDNIQLVRWLPGQNRWSDPLPISLTDNGLHSVIIIPTAGVPLGNYLIAVKGVKDESGRTMAGTQYFHYATGFNATFPYPVDARTFAPYPANAAAVNGTPPAILVFLQKFAGDLPSTINTSNVQLLPLTHGQPGNPLPIGVTYNPWPGVIAISPFFAIGDGAYEIVVNGVTDLAGNVQNGPFTSWFVVNGTGRPQST